MGGVDERVVGGCRVSPVVERARAKLTLSLRICGVRDDGYHLIDAEMVTLDWYDTLTIDPAGTELSADGPYARGMPLNELNIVAKALVLADRTAGVHIHKALPRGGGVGGGSADAAAVLRWAGYDDVAGACVLGADIPFCLVGGRARVTGVGDIVEPLPFVPIDVTLIIPRLSVSTPAVYRAWDNLGGPRSNGDNDLEPAAISAFPALRRWRDRIRDAAGIQPTLAGSGATWFVRGHHDLGSSLKGARVIQTATSPGPT